MRLNIFFGNKRVNRQVNACFSFRLVRHSAQLAHRFGKQLAVHLIAYRFHMPALLRSDNIPCTADFKVAQRDFESRTELRKLLYCTQPLLRVLVQRLVAPERQIRIGKPV